jgi:hypothetical protein
MISRQASFALTLLRLWAGKLLNAIGVPGIVQPGTYEAGIGEASIRVTVGPLFTVVTVNGVDVYLHRFTGAIDGVGFSMATACTPAGARRPERSAVPAAPEQWPAR